jgi:peptidoglycan/LPS O-acetylase OafA/YrhL
MEQSNRILHIDTWRLIAVALVIMHHVTHFSNLSGMASKIPGIIWRLDGLGMLGVLIFFCISGFVICRGLIHEKATSSSVSLSAFYMRRALRIMPPLLIYLGVILAFSAIGLITVSTIEAVRSATFVCNLFWLWECGWFAGHTWSLAYEEQFYLLFPLLFAMAALLRQPRILLFFIAGLTIITLMARAFDYLSLADYCTMFVYMLYGCACALYWEKLSYFFTRMPLSLWLFLTLTTLFLSGFVALPPYAKPLVNVLLLPPLICFVVLGTPLYSPLVRSIFENRFLSYLGKTSYTVYLWQQLATANYPALAPYWTVIFLAAVFFVAHFSYQYFERPLMKIGGVYSAEIKRKVSKERSLAAESFR